MAIYPKAIWRPLPENRTASTITPTQVILHSAVTSADSLYGYFVKDHVRVESHFYVRWDGTVEQYMDTLRKSDANYRANSRAISIETEDDRDPDNKPWSEEQVQALIELVKWLCDTHDIPKDVASGPYMPGIGYHSQYVEWSPVLKTCPGNARKPQVATIIAAVGYVPEHIVVNPAPVPSVGDEMDRLPVLRRGATGQAVRNLQGLLVAAGRRLSVDGDFGPRTETVLREWQAAANAPGGVDGIAGPGTWGRLLGLR